MTTTAPMPEWRRRDFRPLLWALGVAVALHLLAALLFSLIVLWVRSRPDAAPDWARELARPAIPEAVAARRTEPAAEPAWQELPLQFIEIDPANALEEETRDAKFYSSANTRAGQPLPSDKRLQDPEIAGTQKVMPKTFDTARPAQPEPEARPQPREKPAARETPAELKAREAQMEKPQGGPKQAGETQLAMLRPRAAVEDVQDERKAAEAQEPGAPRRRPIKRLAEAREQKGIVLGERMLQTGGAGRTSITPSFDVRSSPFGEYDLRMIAAVQERWWGLLEERRFALERTGKVVVRFNLHADGTISQMKTMESDVGDTLGFTCEAAVLGASPFGRWPSVLRAQAVDPREITFTFNYY